MSAVITHFTGRSEPTTYWMDEAVVSIGSNPHCSLRIPQLESEACILQYRDGTYYVHNRCSHPIRLASQSLLPGQAIIWEDGERLRINQHVTLLLHADGPPEPKRHPIVERDVPRAEPQPLNSRAVQTRIIVAAICVAAALGLLVAATSGSTERPSSLAFQRMVERLLAEQSPSQDEEAYLLHNLQVARYHELRDNPIKAAEFYGVVRDELLHESTVVSSLSPPLKDEVYHFVRARLELLTP